MEDMLAAGKVRAIGISNFLLHHLEALLETSSGHSVCEPNSSST